MRLIDARRTAAALPMPALIAALRERFALGCESPSRHVHMLAGAVPEGTSVASTSLTSLIMPAWVSGAFYGVKIINIAPANAGRGLPGLHASYLLHDATTGVPLALIDGDVLTARRTAATSALGCDFLARPDASRLLVVGAGRIAALLPEAHAAVRPLQQLRVWARKAEAAEALAAEWRARGWAAEAASDLPAACGWADIVSCATLAQAPVVQGAWLRPGSHLDLIGSFTPAMREADGAAFAGARLAVDTEEAFLKAGDLLDARAEGALPGEGGYVTLAQLCRGEAQGRQGPEERSVFKSVGQALEDLAAAMLVWSRDNAPQAPPH